MIPTIRSMIFAALLTVTVLVGGFGLFAAFRVNHEPLARLPVAATPFQLASIDAVPRALSFVAVQPRLESNEALRAVTTAISTRDSDQTEASAPAAISAEDAIQQTAPVATPTAVEHVATAPAMEPTATEPPNSPAASPALTDGVAALPPGTAQPEAAEPVTPAAETEQPRAAEAAASIVETARPEAAVAAPPAEAAQPEAAVVATGSIAEEPPRKAAASKTAVATTPLKPDETARQIANRKRLMALHRARRAHAAAIAQMTNQNNGFSQSSFQSAPGFQSAQSGVGGPFVSPPAAARRQN